MLEDKNISFRKMLGEKELDIVDIFTMSFGLFKENILNFIVLGLFLGLPHTILSLYVKMPVLDMNAFNSINELAIWWQKEITLGFYLLNILSFTLDVILTISIASIVEAMVYRKIPSASWALFNCLKLFFPVLITQILYTVLATLSLSLFIIPGIVFGVFMMFAVYSSSLRHSFGIRAFRYSMQMINKRFFKSFFILSFTVVFLNTIVLTIFKGNIDTRDGVLSYFIASVLYHAFSSYFKVLISLYFLNIDYYMNNSNMDYEMK